MANTAQAVFFKVMGGLFKAHPWHGVPIGEEAPALVNAYIEMVPTDSVKYEVDKATGHLKVDRPQKYSSHCPTLYGFIPKTYCGDRIGEFCAERTGRKRIVGDGDPLDICVLTEKPIQHGDILVRAVPIGGLRMVDGKEADDKIIAVLNQDGAYGQWKDIHECPETLIERLRHYFLTYKDIPGTKARKAEITHVYNAEEAHRVITISRDDYRAKYGDLDELLTIALTPK
ncbi:MAG: inorganic pyrophosphatase [Blastocatellia bacterium]|nr:inorganic pyrophosphatase [Blastocatellia bacterium]